MTEHMPPLFFLVLSQHLYSIGIFLNSVWLRCWRYPFSNGTTSSSKQILKWLQCEMGCFTKFFRIRSPCTRYRITHGKPECGRDVPQRTTNILPTEHRNRRQSPWSTPFAQFLTPLSHWENASDQKYLPENKV